MDVWQEIRSQIDPQCADCVKAWYIDVDTGVFMLEDVVGNSGCAQACLVQALQILASRDLLMRIDSHRCPYCKQDIELDDLDDAHLCRHCKASLGEGEDGLEIYSRYKIVKQRKRDVEWVITIHGMNTFGAWQEEFSWRLAQMYGYSIPVSIYKYGNIKIAAFLYYWRARRVRKFADEIRRRRTEFQRGKPDVIAHSYGTFLLSEMLKSDAYRDIELGRVVLAGSIVRPDFDWKSVLDRGQVEAVLCHCSEKDWVVRLAQFTIPGTGPSGYCGFDQRGSIAHVREIDFGHSDYFIEEHQAHVIKGIWDSFLTRGDVMPEWRGSDADAGGWLPSTWRFLTHALKITLLSIWVMFLVVLPVAAYKGMPEAFQLLLAILGN